MLYPGDGFSAKGGNEEASRYILGIMQDVHQVNVSDFTDETQHEYLL